MIQVHASDVVATPFPHVVAQPFLEPEFYSRLRAEFPSDDLFERDESIGGRSGRDIYRGDREMDALLAASPAWTQLHDYINSASYLDDTLELFGRYLEEFDCKVEQEQFHFVDHIEPRTDLASKSAAASKLASVRKRLQKTDPSDLYCRLDIHQGGVAYGKPIHCDRPNRLVSMIVYFCDQDEIDCDGGELGLHRHLETKPYRDYERHPKPSSTAQIGTIAPKHNLGVFFLCSNNSYHSVEAVRSQRGYRDFIYVNLSSRGPELW